MPDPSGAPRNPLTAMSRVRHWLSTETPASRRACLVLGGGMLLGLAITVLCLRHVLIFDEVFHITTAKALLSQGWSREFLMGTPWSAPGPLYGLLQGAFAPLTGLRPPGIRLVNFACVLGMLALLARTLRLRGVSAPVNAALCLLAAPMGMVVYALALTEAPAMLCAAGGVCLTVLWQREEARPVWRDVLAFCAGLLLGAAVTGRQVFLAALPAIVLLARRGALRPTVLQLVGAAIFPAALFAVWGGLTPPQLRFVGEGLRPSSALLSYAFTGLTVLLLAPRFFSLRPRWALGMAGAVLVLNLTFGIYERLPANFLLAKMHLPFLLLTLMNRLWGAVLLSLAVLFIASALKNLWERWDDRIFVFTCAAALLLALTPIKITHVWDARYMIVTLPFLAVPISGWITHNYARLFLMMAGVAVAAFYLNHYKKLTLDEDHLPPMPAYFDVQE